MRYACIILSLILVSLTSCNTSAQRGGGGAPAGGRGGRPPPRPHGLMAYLISVGHGSI
jgi:hypothetical protein